MRGEKTVEYRSQTTQVRGRVYIYALLAKPEPHDAPVTGELQRGVIVGTVEVTGCKGADGEYELLLESPQRLPEPIRGASGWLRVEQLTVRSLDTEESLLVSGITDDGRTLDRETYEKFLTIPAMAGNELNVDPSVKSSMDAAIQAQAGRVVTECQRRNETFFDAESDKLDLWADDLKENLERELKNIEFEIREAKKAKRLAVYLQSKVASQKRVNELEKQRNHKKRTHFDAKDQIEQRKDELITDVEAGSSKRPHDRKSSRSAGGWSRV